MPNTKNTSDPVGSLSKPRSWGARLLGFGLGGAWVFAASVIAFSTVSSVRFGWVLAGPAYFAGFYPAARVLGLR